MYITFSLSWPIFPLFPYALVRVFYFLPPSISVVVLVIFASVLCILMRIVRQLLSDIISNYIERAFSFVPAYRVSLKL